jgi:hypothetical protein
MAIVLTAVAYMYILSEELPKLPYITWLGSYVIGHVMIVFMITLEVIAVKASAYQFSAEEEMAESDGLGGLTARQRENEAEDLLSKKKNDTFRFSPDLPPFSRKLRKFSRRFILFLLLALNGLMLFRAWTYRVASTFTIPWVVVYYVSIFVLVFGCVGGVYFMFRQVERMDVQAGKLRREGYYSEESGGSEDEDGNKKLK